MLPIPVLEFLHTKELLLFKRSLTLDQSQRTLINLDIFSHLKVKKAEYLLGQAILKLPLI